ncbi:unnamed protein product [Adineta ricciae]|uniref:WW domain-containing protein n=1 Tax=Adineta ricciae TaxID=249248 RepID=A0A814JK13_ADIRI|nr:unnamed protein product [Adineta ricciae]
MTDYWKSGEKHFCTFCKCWLAGNKISIDLHESGNHHKSMVRAKVEQLRKANIEKERESKNFSDTLGQMERAANAAYTRDLANSVMPKTSDATSDISLPSKLKRPVDQPVQVQIKKPKFVIKTPTAKPVYEPIVTPSENETKVPKKEQIASVSEANEEAAVTINKTVPKEPEETATTANNSEGTWYESKTENQESFYWNDTTGASTWTPPTSNLFEFGYSIHSQRYRHGIKG